MLPRWLLVFRPGPLPWSGGKRVTFPTPKELWLTAQDIAVSEVTHTRMKPKRTRTASPAASSGAMERVFWDAREAACERERGGLDARSTPMLMVVVRGEVTDMGSGISAGVVPLGGG